jgi:hypothetical protein
MKALLCIVIGFTFLLVCVTRITVYYNIRNGTPGSTITKSGDDPE